MKRALIGSSLVLASMLVACGDAEPSSDSLRHTVCDRLAVTAGKDTPGQPDMGPLSRTVPRELRKLRDRDPKGYEEFADVIEEWIAQGGNEERTRDQLFVVFSRTCSSELHDHQAAICRTELGVAVFQPAEPANRASLNDVLDGEVVCHNF